MSYTPQLDGIPYKVIAYFKRFPDEELSNKDIGLKYSCAPSGVKNILAAAVDAGLLKQDGAIYSAGDKIAEASAPTTSNQQPAAPATVFQADKKQSFPWNTSQRKPPKQTAPVYVDFTALKVEVGIPVISTKSAGANKWQPLFDLLTQPDQSIQLPKEAMGAVGAEISKRHKNAAARYKKAAVSATHFRIWRTL